MKVTASRSAAADRRVTDWIAARARRTLCPVIGINGAQGAGKTTLANRLQAQLQDLHGLRAVVVSLDDFYLPRAERVRLAAAVHPLFATRGVPGTHEVDLGCSILDALRILRPGASLSLPTFSKALDDRSPEPDWPVVTGPCDLILFEGWCVGTPPQADTALRTPLNTLERDDDAGGRWRHAVNACLAGAYAQWFARLDGLVFLEVPDLDSVLRWRTRQEHETAARHGASTPLLAPAALHRFLAHYERLTRHALAVLPGRADVVLRLRADHAIAEAIVRRN